MTLDDLFNDLAYGELAGTGIVGIDGGVIPLAKYPQVITYVNTGLTQLHTIFLLKENYVSCRQILGQTDYLLHSKHGDAAGVNGFSKHIMDTVSFPFTDDILMIEYLTDEVGDLIVLNDDTITWPYFTSGHKQITVDTVDEDTIFHVIYRANHAVVPLATTDLTAVEIDIPANFRHALELFVASKAFASINSTDARKRSVVLYQEFLAQVKMLKELNQGTMGYPSDHTNSTTRVKGWL